MKSSSDSTDSSWWSRPSLGDARRRGTAAARVRRLIIRAVRQTAPLGQSICRTGRLAPAMIVATVLLIASPPVQLSGQCRVTGTGPAADASLAQAACDRVTERFVLLFGTTPPGGTIELSDTIDFAAVREYSPTWTLVWPTSDRLRAFFADAARVDQTVEAAVEEQWSAVLPHELGHVLLSAEAARRRVQGEAARGLPDWIHEGTAVWMEPAAYRTTELDIIRALRPYVPPIEQLLSISISTPAARAEAGSSITRTFYPCSSEEACGGRPHWSETFSVTTRQFPDGRTVVDTVFHDQPPAPPSPAAANFYVYSAALVRYISHRGGSTAVNALLDRYAASGSSGVELAGLPGLPTTPAALQRDWERWVERYLFRP